MCSRGTVRIKTIYQLALDIHLPRITSAASHWQPPDSGEFKAGNTIPMVVVHQDSARIDVARFGFKFEWSSGLVTNARAETLDEKKTWAQMLYHQRCAVPITGFWEWNVKKRCYTIFSLDPLAKEVMYVAGLWSKTGQDGSKSLAMVTTEPNEVVAKVHPRMPAILGPKEVVQWVDYGTTNRLNRWQLKDLLVPYRGELYRDDLLAA